ncbi:transglutaminase-like domain-containing protein [Bordetella genomosp. 13]|uniref:transglutaminase-like domain-containing protein n=1 Tax=Bordetella genomosp. 13 TaxID=463040 RepID=UPI00119ED02D|nr:transglutaminase family protein [Bordetella genomosp. 13]
MIDAEKVRIALSVDLEYEIGSYGADFIFNIHAAHTARQSVSSEHVSLSQPIVADVQTEPLTGNRYMRLRAMPGLLKVAYRATLELQHHRAEPARLNEVAIRDLPLATLGYLYPSRYCESDKLMRIAMKQFGAMAPGYARVQAIMAWVQKEITYLPNTSGSSTSAVDTLLGQTGVCRDFAHLMITLCRSLNIPARFTTGTDYGADPMIGPPDFHAYVEVYVGDRWYIFDPSGTGVPMGFVRIGTGRDAADVSFATMFGAVTPLCGPKVDARAIEDASAGIVRPYHTHLAISTDTP